MSPRLLPLLVSLLAALAVAFATRLPGAEPAFAGGFAILWVWRLLFGLDGRALVPRRVWGLLLGALLAVGLPYLLTHAHGAEAATFVLAMLGVLTCFLGVLLLAPLSAFGAFWIVLLATTLVSVSCSLDVQLLGALLVPLYVALLALTLVVLERVASLPTETRADTPGRVLVRDPEARAGRALASGVLRLVVLGLGVGALLWVAFPRPGPGGDDARDSSGERAGSDGPLWTGGSNGIARTGPDVHTQDALLGAVGRIQVDKRVHWEVRLLEGDAEPPLLLREGVRDLWLDLPGGGEPRWRASRQDERRTLVPAADGWVQLNEPTPGRTQRRLAARARLAVGLVFLDPEPLAFRVERPLVEDDPLGPHVPLDDATEWTGSGRLRRRVLAGDVVELRSEPQPRSGAALLGRESSARVAPLTSYATLGEPLRRRLLALTRDVPGADAADPWLRAQALERWLHGPGFSYDLSSPELEAGRRVEDFLTRVRRGNCEWYATALTLALRAHGLAARYVQGYWGGSHTQRTNLWTFYGWHYHAWTELYLDGVGWVPLNPTPPERLAEGADPRTQEAGGRGQGDDRTEGRGPGARLRDGLAAMWGALLDALRACFGPATLYLGYVALTLLLVLGALRWRTQARSGQTPQAAAGPALGPYLDALRLLARHGHARRAGSTAREHLARVNGSLEEEGARAFARLTKGHELERYAGRRGATAEGAQDVLRLARSLARKPQRT